MSGVDGRPAADHVGAADHLAVEHDAPDELVGVVDIGRQYGHQALRVGRAWRMPGDPFGVGWRALEYLLQCSHLLRSAAEQPQVYWHRWMVTKLRAGTQRGSARGSLTETARRRGCATYR